MARIKNLQTIIQDFIDFIKLAQPDADTKPSTVIRDILIDAPATQLSAYYDQLGLVSTQLSFKDLSGTDIENYVRNFGINRKNSVPATGIALLTFNNIFSDIGISSGDLIYSSNGLSFSVLNGATVSSRNVNYYRSVALKYKNDLDFLGITDQYAVEVTVQCTSPGVIGNISKYGLSRTNITNVTNVTNIFQFDNGRDSETDAVLKNRFLSSLNGASTGTNLGYSSAALSVVGVTDSAVIEPGDPLMTRDGTEVQINDDGTREIISEGTGGKVDVLVLGKNLQENIESFIYRDKSNTNNASSTLNDFILGQIASIDGKTISRKRFQSNQLGLLPLQPVEEVIEVTGSESGGNFIPKSVDEFGRITGNFEIIKDLGNFGGSPFASDKFHWISNQITNFFEDKIKGQSSGQDKVNFTDVIKFNKVTQNLPIKNENSTIILDNRYIQLLHTPATNVSRVFNTNTGEQYLVTNQNPDGGLTNTTGKVQITGKTLPRATDTLQVDYNWIFEYDRFYDFDGKVNTNNERQVTDSIDWGYNSLTTEKVLFIKDGSGNFFTGTTSNNIASLIDIKSYTSGLAQVLIVNSGQYINRKSIDYGYLPEKITSIEGIFSEEEIWSTSANNGIIVTSLENDSSHHLKVILPTDTTAENLDWGRLKANPKSLLANSTSNNNVVTIPTGTFTGISKIELEIVYIAKVNELTSIDVSNLPTYRSSNGFTNISSVPVNSKTDHVYVREVLRVYQNFASQRYIDLNCFTDNTTMTPDQIIGITRISDGYSFSSNPTIAINDGQYRVIIDPTLNPSTNDIVIIFYKPLFKQQSQPAMFQNDFTLHKYKDFIDLGTNFGIQLSSLIVDDSGFNFEIINAFTKEIESSYNDGYIISGVLASASVPIPNSSPINNKLIKITSGLNIGTYVPQAAFMGYQLTFGPYLSKDNVVITRVQDNKDLSTNVVSVAGGYVIFSKNNLGINDKIILSFITTSKMRSVPTKLSLNLIDQNTNTGVIQINGDSFLKVEAVFTATSTGLKQNISELLRSKGLANSGYAIGNITYLAKVNTVSYNSEEIISINNVYDLKNCKIKNNFYSNMLSESNLSDIEFELVDNINNTLDNGSDVFLPKIGDRLQIVIYLMKQDDSEILSFVRPGILYTSKNFMTIENIKILSGFKNTVNSRLSVNNMNQPGLNSRYRAFYDYVGPKNNERIVIRYNYNKLINEVTTAIEKIRPINADVIAKEAKEVGINVTMNIVIVTGSQVSSNTIVQNLRDAVINSLNSETLGGTIDSSDLINAAYSITGVDRVRIIGFNKNNESGQVLSITAQKDEYFVANNVIINVESR